MSKQIKVDEADLKKIDSYFDARTKDEKITGQGISSKSTWSEKFGYLVNTAIDEERKKDRLKMKEHEIQLLKAQNGELDAVNQLLKIRLKMIAEQIGLSMSPEDLEKWLSGKRKRQDSDEDSD